MNYNDLKLVISSFEYTVGYRLKLVLAFFLTGGEILTSLITPILWGSLIQYIVSSNYQWVLRILVLLGVVYLMQAIILYFKTYLYTYIEENITFNIKKKTYKLALNFSSSALDQMDDGEVLSHLDGDTQAMAAIFTGAFLQSVIAILKLIIIAIIVCRINYMIAIVVVLSFPISYGLLYIFGKKLKKENEKSRSITDHYFSFVQESISNLKELKGQGLKRKNLIQFDNVASGQAKVDIKIGKISALSNSLIIMIDFFSQMIIYIIGIYLMSQGELELQYFIAVVSYALMLADTLMEIAQLGPNMQSAIVSIKRIYDFRETESEKFGNEKLQINTSTLQFKGINFAYTESPVLEDISFEFNSNGKYAIVGESGSGKTTIIELILKLYSPDNGSILVNQQQLEDLSEDSIRDNIAIVSQEPILFNESIFDNLTLWNTNIQKSRVEELCKEVNLDSFIKSLPDGYKTVLSEGGKNLSVGQRQRLALVRALLKNTRIILLDEVMASQDAISRDKLLKLINQIKRYHLVIMVEHRLNNIVDSEKIIVIKKGLLVGNGTHNDLMKNCEYYQQLFIKEKNSI